MIAAVHQIDLEIGIEAQGTMREGINRSPSAYLHRSSAWLVSGFAFVALLLGIVGLYGVVAYSVSQRTREIGIRMALGAERGNVYGLIMREAGRLTLAGLAGGLLVLIRPVENLVIVELAGGKRLEGRTRQVQRPLALDLVERDVGFRGVDALVGLVDYKQVPVELSDVLELVVRTAKILRPL